MGVGVVGIAVGSMVGVTGLALAVGRDSVACEEAVGIGVSSERSLWRSGRLQLIAVKMKNDNRKAIFMGEPSLILVISRVSP
jgi:hypothetical protein